ncbi:MAG: MFS transporter [Nitrososphaerales archaeon]
MLNLQKGISSKAIEILNLMKNKVILFGLSVTLIAFTLIGGFFVYLPLYMKYRGYDEFFIGLALSLPALSGALSRMPLGLIIDKYKNEQMMLLPFLILSSLLTFLIANFSSLLQLLALLLILGFFNGSSTLAAIIFVARRANVQELGKAMGFLAMARSLGITLGPALYSQVLLLYGEESFDLGFYSLSLFTLSLSLMVFFLLKTSRGKTL